MADPRQGLTEEEARSLTERILALTSADEARVNLSSGWEGNTRYAMNRITTAGETDVLNTGSGEGMEERQRQRGLGVLAFRVSLVLLLLCPSAASGQFEYGLSLEPYGGVFFDGFRNDRGAGHPGWVGGVRFGYELGWAMDGAKRALRLVLDGARAQTDEAGGATVADSIDVLFRNEWWLATAGVEWDVLPGWTGVSLELRGGGSWLEQEITHASEPISGGETPGTTSTPDSELRPVVAAGLSVVHHLNPTLQARARVEDLWIDPLGGEGEHSPALSVGLRILFR